MSENLLTHSIKVFYQPNFESVLLSLKYTDLRSEIRFRYRVAKSSLRYEAAISRSSDATSTDEPATTASTTKSQLIRHHGFRRNCSAQRYETTDPKSQQDTSCTFPTADLRNRGHPRGDARSSSSPRLPRQLRRPPHSPQQVPERDVVRPVEVRGKEQPAHEELSTPQQPPSIIDAERRVTQTRTPSLTSGNYAYRTNATATKSANTRSSRSVFPRWRS